MQNDTSRGWLDRARELALRWLPAPKPPAPSAPPPAPYADSVGISVAAEACFSPDNWDYGGTRGTLAKDGEGNRTIRLTAGPALSEQIGKELSAGWQLVAVVPEPVRYPTISGTARVFKSMKPQRVILDEDLILTFANANGSVSVAVGPEDAGDLILVSAYIGCHNCFPTAPTVDAGLSGRSLGPKSIGTHLNWPIINAGIDVTISIAVKPTALYRAKPPEGYTHDDLVSVRVLARLSLFGQLGVF